MDKESARTLTKPSEPSQGSTTSSSKTGACPVICCSASPLMRTSPPTVRDSSAGKSRSPAISRALPSGTVSSEPLTRARLGKRTVSLACTALQSQPPEGHSLPGPSMASANVTSNVPTMSRVTPSGMNSAPPSATSSPPMVSVPPAANASAASILNATSLPMEMVVVASHSTCAA